MRKSYFQILTAIIALSIFTPLVSGQTEKVLYSFSGGADGSSPVGGVILDAKGNLFGVTQSGGTSGAGTVYELTPSSRGTWTKTMLYSFGFGGADVYFPGSNLVIDVNGNLFGIAPLGGANGAGGIYELTPGSGGTWSENVIFSFPASNPAWFQTGLTRDAAGNFYCYSAEFFSSTTVSYGAVLEIQSGSNGTWISTVLHTFSGGNDGSASYAVAPALDFSGNLYGVAGNGPADFGLVFELARGSNGSWSEKALHAFKGGSDGTGAYSVRPIIDSSGNVFAASSWSIFELTPGANGTWTEKVLHTFTGGKDGAYPVSITSGPGGVIYGLTNAGGAHHGTVFSLTPGSNGWTEKILHRFTATNGDGFYPNAAPLTIDARGNLYGTTSVGGSSNNGVVFEVTP
ncbi:MAG TPA: choice-of-anchor tandem repeat GloVer-containing protein [Dongiaceae bacterium]|nr:choice-of-anchor tandem repeat GloVer-containing protein [Dongiaceae bacterium]